MGVYGWVGHFVGRPSGSAARGVEQIVLDSLASMLAPPGA
jgi:hypothetical protein